MVVLKPGLYVTMALIWSPYGSSIFSIPSDWLSKRNLHVLLIFGELPAT